MLRRWQHPRLAALIAAPGATTVFHDWVRNSAISIRARANKTFLCRAVPSAWRGDASLRSAAQREDRQLRNGMEPRGHDTESHAAVDVHLIAGLSEIPLPAFHA